MFKQFKKQVQQNFDKLAVDNLFYVTIDRDKIFEVYLNGFTSLEERQAHNCNCCKSFLRQYGGIVAIDPVNNSITSIWDFKGTDELYEGSRENLSAYIHSLPITDVFVNNEKHCGTDSNFDMIKNVTWNHFYFPLPIKFIKPNIDSFMGEARTTRQMLKRNLTELSIDATETVLELIAQNSLYRGKEFEAILKDYREVQKEFLTIPEEQKENYLWLNSVDLSPSISRIRNTAMGTLLIDLSEGMDLERAVGKFEDMMSGTKYKRTTALVTPKMTEDAKKKLQDLGLLESLERRFATEADLNVNDILFTDKFSRVSDVFEEIIKKQTINPKTFSKIEEISIEDFIEKVIPTTKSIEILVENPHLNNLVSMVTAVDSTAPSLFKWNNSFSWAYTGDIADSMKERVKSAGGKIDGDLRFSIQWNEDGKSIIDLDAHAHEGGSHGEHIYYSSPFRKDRRNRTLQGGQLDVDMINPVEIGVENITWLDRKNMNDGDIKLSIHNFSKHRRFDGFRAEVEFDGEIHEFGTDKPFLDYMDIATVNLSKGVFTIKSDMKGSSSMNSKEKWNIKTNQFHKVDKMMLSPNYWGTSHGGNKHYFFLSNNCKADEAPRPFFNEFLKSEFTENRKVFEIVGAKLKIEPSENQLSGIGFSDTQRGHIIVRVEGKFKRTLKVNI